MFTSFITYSAPLLRRPLLVADKQTTTEYPEATLQKEQGIGGTCTSRRIWRDFELPCAL